MPPPYARDVQRLCDSVEQSGAGSATEGNDRMVLIAMWLGKSLETQEMRNFLVHFQSLDPAAKRAALETEATRANIGHCALVDEWR